MIEIELLEDSRETFAISRLSITILPEFNSKNRNKSFIKVDFPEPETPTKPIFSPASIFNF